MNNEIILKITPTSISVLDMQEGTSKYIDPEDLLQLISLSNEGFKYRMGTLPDNILDVALEEPGHKRKVLLFFPRGTFDFKSQSKDFKQIEFPSLLFYFEVSGKKITQTRIAALKNIHDKKEIKQSTRIYRYPFTHVHSNMGVCWGSNPLPDIVSLHQLNGVPYMFINSFSAVNHYSGYYKDSDKMSMTEFLTALENKEIAIDDYLIPTDYTFSTLCDYLFGEETDDCEYVVYEDDYDEIGVDTEN